MDTLQKRDASLGEVLKARARSASDTRLAADAAGGFIVAVVTLAWPYPLWYLVLPAACCFLAFGVWGIADRELGERGDTVTLKARRTLRIVQALAIVVGGASAAALALTLLGIAIGRVIS
jgi:hypothetical protein